MKRLPTWILAGVLAASLPARAEFLFAPSSPTANGFFTPTLDYQNLTYEYSAWDVFYAPHTAGNFPDRFAPYGGVEQSPGVWAPEQRTAAGFAPSPHYNPSNPYAFWDSRNATITQVKSTSAFIIGPDISGNIYTFQDKTGYRLQNAPDYAGGLGTVIFQFQTDGTNADFANIRLVYKGVDGNDHTLGVNAPQTEYLREYSTTGSDHWSAAAGYRNRVLFQWDLSGVEGTGEYRIEWEALSSSMSLQKADLVTASSYEVGMPVSSAWIGGNGLWSEPGNWTGQAGSVPLENGNLKFKNASPAALQIDDSDHLVGEIIFENAASVTVSATDGQKLIANTGITTRSSAPDAEAQVYRFDADYEFGALNFFEINTGRVIMNGSLSGAYGMVKLGQGALELNGHNTFSGFLAVQHGELRISGSNSYAGSTTVVNGRLIAAHNAALGSSSAPVTVGGDAGLYAFTTGSAHWLAELLIEGDHVVARDIALAPGDLAKRLGAFQTGPTGAVFSGDISFSGVPADPDAPGGTSAAGNVRLTAQASGDQVTFLGRMTGGLTTKDVTLDGQGTVIFAGAEKSYNSRTVIQSGTLILAEGVTVSGQGDWLIAAGASLQAEAGAHLRVNGTLQGAGAFALNGATLSGSGTIAKSLVIDQGDILSPGDRVGAMTVNGDLAWADGGTLVWEISQATGEAGTGWDFVALSGSLDFSSSSEAFVIELISLSSSLPGPLADFDPSLNYDWKILAAAGGITGFDRTAFTLDTSGFTNAFDGNWTLSETEGGLYLTYTAVPEPRVWFLLALGCLGFAVRAALLRTKARREPPAAC